MHLRSVYAAAIFAGLGVTLGAGVPGHACKLDQALRHGASGEVQVIVRARPGLKASLRSHLRRQGTLLKEHALIGAVTVRIPADRLPALDLDNTVESVSLDAPMVDTAASSTQVDAPPPAGSQLAASLGLPVQGVTGRGVGVAVIDSGTEPSADFGPIAFYDFTPVAGHHPYDDYGHGTHVSGLIASKGRLSQTDAGPLYQGIAPKARLISLKVLDANGTAMTSTVIDAIEFATSHKDALGIDIINLSLGHPILAPANTDPLVLAVEAATQAGIVVVVAAGNVGQNPKTGAVGYAGILSPGNAESAITVGAIDTKNSVTRSDDTIPAYSSRGPTWYDARPKPDVVAAGQNLVSDAALGSTLYLEHPDNHVTVNGSKSRFLRLSGTSMAAAVTSGVAALVIDASRQAEGTLTPRVVKEILEYTATPMHGYDGLTQGHGAVNAAGAIALAKSLGKSTHTQLFTVVGGEAWPWSQSTTFPRELVYGDGTQIPGWAATIVWGTIRDGDTIVWGTSRDGDTIVWGTTADGDTIVWGTTVDGDTIVWGTGTRSTSSRKP